MSATSIAGPLQDDQGACQSAVRDATTAVAVDSLRDGWEVAFVATDHDGTHFYMGHTLRTLQSALTHYNAHIHLFLEGYRGEINPGLAARLLMGRHVDGAA